MNQQQQKERHITDSNRSHWVGGAKCIFILLALNFDLDTTIIKTKKCLACIGAS